MDNVKPIPLIHLKNIITDNPNQYIKVLDEDDDLVFNSASNISNFSNIINDLIISIHRLILIYKSL
jgi:hypothetical protein